MPNSFGRRHAIQFPGRARADRLNPSFYAEIQGSVTGSEEQDGPGARRRAGGGGARAHRRRGHRPGAGDVPPTGFSSSSTPAPTRTRPSRTPRRCSTCWRGSPRRTGTDWPIESERPAPAGSTRRTNPPPRWGSAVNGTGAPGSALHQTSEPPPVDGACTGPSPTVFRCPIP